jgi:hypothetical protein
MIETILLELLQSDLEIVINKSLPTSYHTMDLICQLRYVLSQFSGLQLIVVDVLVDKMYQHRISECSGVRNCAKYGLHLQRQR